jgi:polyhydroxybutyrate depolymerase
VQIMAMVGMTGEADKVILVETTEEMSDLDTTTRRGWSRARVLRVALLVPMLLVVVWAATAIKGGQLSGRRLSGAASTKAFEDIPRLKNMGRSEMEDNGTRRLIFDSAMEGIAFQHNGIEREANVFVADSAKGKASPLVLSFHAWAANAFAQNFLDDWDAVAEEEGLIVAYPKGYSLPKAGIIPFPIPTAVIGGSTFNGGGCCPYASEEKIDDVGFAKALVAYIDKHVSPVDLTRVYATGMSNGGFMAHRLGCEAADTFAAIAPVAGLMATSQWESLFPIMWGVDEYTCKPSRPVPVMHFHGSMDGLVTKFGGPPANFASVKNTIESWLTINGLGSWDDMEQTYSNLAATCWTSGGNDNQVTYCEIMGMTHNWPGTFPWHGISATRESWKFFKTKTSKKYDGPTPSSPPTPPPSPSSRRRFVVR